MAKATEDRRLTRVTAICEKLPDAERTLSGDHASFTVRKRTFTYFLNNHHGDGIVAVNCKVLPGDNEALIRSDPSRFYMPAYIGHRGWVGLRLDTPQVDWEEVDELIKGSYQLLSPKRKAKPK